MSITINSLWSKLDCGNSWRPIIITMISLFFWPARDHWEMRDRTYSTLRFKQKSINTDNTITLDMMTKSFLISEWNSQKCSSPDWRDQEIGDEKQYNVRESDHSVDEPGTVQGHLNKIRFTIINYISEWEPGRSSRCRANPVEGTGGYDFPDLWNRWLVFRKNLTIPIAERRSIRCPRSRESRMECTGNLLIDRLDNTRQSMWQ